jgi:multicomponent Na+:H+ antiporter subunit G
MPGAVLDISSWLLILSGAAFGIIGAVGQLRFPDFWARLHAASVIDSAGMVLLTAGMCLHSGFTLTTVKLIIIGVFLFITGATSTHAVASAALVSGLKPPALGKPKSERKTVGKSEPAKK